MPLTGGGLRADWDKEWRGDSFQGIRAFSLEHMEPIQPSFPTLWLRMGSEERAHDGGTGGPPSRCLPSLICGLGMGSPDRYPFTPT